MRVFFFPYDDLRSFEQLHSIVRPHDIVISYFPCSSVDTVRQFQEKGAKVLSYVSIYKLPVVNELDNALGFYKSNVSKCQVGQNPFWRSVSVEDKENTDSIILKDGDFLRPFDDPFYRQGWYLADLRSETLVNRIYEGVDKLILNTGLDGLFVDNVVSRIVIDKMLNSELLSIRNSVLSNIYGRLKNYSKEKMLFLNAGKNVFNDIIVPADYYVGEYFYPDRKYEELVRNKTETGKKGMGFLAYYKVSGALSDKEITNYLTEIDDFCAVNAISWSFRITNTDSFKKLELCKNLKIML
jgi:hypothetical protein